MEPGLQCSFAVPHLWTLGRNLCLLRGQPWTDPVAGKQWTMAFDGTASVWQAAEGGEVWWRQGVWK